MWRWAIMSMPVRRLWPRTDKGLLYANLLVYGSTIALLVGFHREMSWAAKTVDGYVRSGRYQTTADRLLVKEAMHYRRSHEEDLEGVAALLRRAVEVDAYSNARIHLAATYHEQGKDDAALAMYERYRSIDPLELRVYVAMVGILEKRGEREAAERLLTKGITYFRIQLERYEPHLDASVARIFNHKAWAIHQRLTEELEVLEKTRARIRESM
jgi:tetratricopeptide (TPR) repeat protein